MHKYSECISLLIFHYDCKRYFISCFLHEVEIESQLLIYDKEHHLLARFANVILGLRGKKKLKERNPCPTLAGYVSMITSLEGYNNKGKPLI